MHGWSSAVVAVGVAMSAADASATHYNVSLTVLQRMSDVRHTAETCEAAQWTSGRCWLGDSWKSVAAAGMAAVDDFNHRRGDYVPAFASDAIVASTARLP